MNSRFDLLVPVRRHANIPHPIHSRDVSKHNQQFTPICDRYTIVQQHNTYITGTLYTPFYKIEHNSFLFRIMDTKKIMKFVSICVYPINNLTNMPSDQQSDQQYDQHSDNQSDQHFDQQSDQQSDYHSDNQSDQQSDQ